MGYLRTMHGHTLPSTGTLDPNVCKSLLTADILALERLFEQCALSMQTPSLALSINKSRAIQPGQPLPGVLDFGQAGVGILPKVKESLLMLFGFSPRAHAIFCLSLWKAHSF